MHSPRTGVLLINLGTPDSPETADVRRYLDEFLMDPYVVDIPFVLRWLLVKGVILRKRVGFAVPIGQRDYDAKPISQKAVEKLADSEKEAG